MIWQEKSACAINHICIDICCGMLSAGQSERTEDRKIYFARYWSRRLGVGPT